MMADEIPPPLPVKVRRYSTGMKTRKPTGLPVIVSQLHDNGLVGGAKAGATGDSDLPPVPLRRESISRIKNSRSFGHFPSSGALKLYPSPLTLGGAPERARATEDILKAKEDNPDIVPPLPLKKKTSSPRLVRPKEKEVMNVFNTIRRYNEDIRKAKENGPDAAPPLPLKKKTVMMYKGLLVQGYIYDESIMEPLYIPGMEAPPPIPPKKRKKNKSSAQNQGHIYEFNEDLEEVNYLECEETTGYLVFNKEETGGYTLKGGPVDALITYAASSAKSVMHFSEAFLLTYYTFINPDLLISKLLYRLKYFYRSENQAIWQATASLLVRALTVLKKSLSKESEVELLDLIHLLMTDDNVKFAQLLRTALVDKLNRLMTEYKAPMFGEVFTSKTHRKHSIMDYSAESIARQMTILDNQLFQRVDVCEMLYWAKEQSEEKSPMLTLFTLHFNNVSQWTKATLLKRGQDMRNRCKLMLHFIAVMKSLLETFNNFNSYLAILSAIEAAPISRLDWNDRILRGLEEPRQLIDNRGSFKNYREAFAQAKPPCIPYVGLYLQDLTFIEMQPSKLAEDPSATNFTKRWMQFKSVDQIRFAQSKPYTFNPDPELLNLFKNFEVEETDEKSSQATELRKQLFKAKSYMESMIYN